MSYPISPEDARPRLHQLSYLAEAPEEHQKKAVGINIPSNKIIAFTFRLCNNLHPPIDEQQFQSILQRAAKPGGQGIDILNEASRLTNKPLSRRVICEALCQSQLEYLLDHICPDEGLQQEFHARTQGLESRRAQLRDAPDTLHFDDIDKLTPYLMSLSIFDLVDLAIQLNVPEFVKHPYRHPAVTPALIRRMLLEAIRKGARIERDEPLTAKHIANILDENLGQEWIADEIRRAYQLPVPVVCPPAHIDDNSLLALEPLIKSIDSLGRELFRKAENGRQGWENLGLGAGLTDKMIAEIRDDPNQVMSRVPRMCLLILQTRGITWKELNELAKKAGLGEPARPGQPSVYYSTNLKRPSIEQIERFIPKFSYQWKQLAIKLQFPWYGIKFNCDQEQFNEQGAARKVITTYLKRRNACWEEVCGALRAIKLNNVATELEAELYSKVGSPELQKMLQLSEQQEGLDYDKAKWICNNLNLNIDIDTLYAGCNRDPKTFRREFILELFKENPRLSARQLSDLLEGADANEFVLCIQTAIQLAEMNLTPDDPDINDIRKLTQYLINLPPFDLVNLALQLGVPEHAYAPYIHSETTAPFIHQILIETLKTERTQTGKSPTIRNMTCSLAVALKQKRAIADKIIRDYYLPPRLLYWQFISTATDHQEPLV